MSARHTCAGDFAWRKAAARVSCFEERQELRRYADDGLSVDCESVGPAIPVFGHSVRELFDGLGFVDVLAVLWAEDTGIVDQDVDEAYILLDIFDCSFDGVEVGHIADDVLDDRVGGW